MDTTTFPFGYRFNFTFPADITVNGKQLKGKIPYEFKIKKGTGNSLTLEQAWTDDNVFTKKAGLECKTDNKECSVSSTGSQKLNVKLGHQKKEGISTISSGKIKVEKEQEGYNQGLKFSITDGGVTFTGGTGDDITKLEELETYEIAEDGGKYYLTKKTSPDDLIKKTLSLPDECKLPTTDSPVQCTLDETNFKKINFDGKESEKPTGSATLTISKANATDFPFGYKFTFKTTADAEIKSDTKIKAKIPKDFKIKKGSGTGASVTLSLEKAWDDSTYSLAKKVGLTCSTSDGSDTCCSQTTGSPQVKLNVKKGSDIKEGIDSVTLGTGKIKVEKDQEGYNQGLKFTITTSDVTLTGGEKVGNSADFSSLEEFETYEITEDKGKYYLTRKTSKEDVLKTSLSIPEGCFTSLGTSCTLTSDQLKNIKFEGKDNFNPSGTATLTITKADSTDFPLGYRFTLLSEQEITIKSSDIKVKAKIPTDFKIKKNQSTPTTLTLEKAWNDGDYSFAKKAGLDCTTGSSECCSLSSGSNLNVKKGNDKKDGITGISAASGGSGKIKVEKEQAGYNQGLKFTITGGDVSLTGGNKAQGSNNEITTLDEYETYEITEEGGKYYLTRKDEAIKTIETQLGLGESGCSLSTFPSSCTLDTNKIKKINFDGKETNGATLASGTATLTISKTDKKDDFPMGYKFTLLSQQEITIKSDNKVKANISTDFKIKKNASGQSPTLSLEKAWTADGLGKKVGLTCNGSNNDECSIANSGSQLKVRQNNNGTDIKHENLTKKSGSGNSAKIKVTKDQEGYNQGFKFTVEGGSIELDGSTASYAGDKINILDEYETYEIKEDGGKWYLTRKQESIIFIKKQLGLDFCTDNSWSRLVSGTSGSSISLICNIGSLENLKKIKFNNSSDNFSWPTGKIELILEMKKSRNSNNENFGEWEVTISDNRDSKEKTSSLCIPDGNGGKVDVKTATGGAKYKINKNGGGGGSSSWCLTKNGGGSGSCS